MRIPNLNTFGTYIERFIIENVKRVHFETMRDESTDQVQKDNLTEKIDHQALIVSDIRAMAINDLEDILYEAKYQYYKEGRSLRQ